MSVTDRDQHEQERVEPQVELNDLGTVAEADLEAARADADLRTESRAAREALETLARDGRLITG